MTKQEEIINLVASWLKDYCPKHDTTDSGWVIIPEVAWERYRQDAIRLLKGEASQGVVIKVERELPEPPREKMSLVEGWVELTYGDITFYKATEKWLRKAGYAPVMPLIEEK